MGACIETILDLLEAHENTTRQVATAKFRQTSMIRCSTSCAVSVTSL